MARYRAGDRHDRRSPLGLRELKRYTRVTIRKYIAGRSPLGLRELKHRGLHTRHTV